MGSVFKFSIATVVNMGILAVSMLITGNLIDPEIFGEIDLFVGFTGTVMTMAILGMDQALIRFYHEPPKGLTANGVFRLSFYFSSAFLLVAGVVCSTLLQKPLYEAITFRMLGHEAVPLLFLNAFFYMVARYFNVLYRMEMNVAVYTVESILMQFFYKLFYLLGALFPNPLFAMMVCSLVGLGGFALVFSFVRREALRPRAAEFKSGGYRTILPYGLAIAPTAIFVTANAQVAKPILRWMIPGEAGEGIQGMYSFSYQLSNVVSMIQMGFAAFWGAYMFENYKTQQARIRRVHDYLNLVILVFFCFLVAFQDLIFFIFRQYTGSQAQYAFPLMMLGAVFTILCETTVYGNAICKRPIFDTIGIGISLVVNVVCCLVLIPLFGPENGLYGAAVAVAVSGFAMFLFRTLTAQRLYRTINSPLRTSLAILLAVAVTVAGVALATHFWLKLLVCAAATGLYCLMYRKQLKRCWQIGIGILQAIFDRLKSRG